MALYEIAILNSSASGGSDLRYALMKATEAFHLSWGDDVVVVDDPAKFAPAAARSPCAGFSTRPTSP